MTLLNKTCAMTNNHYCIEEWVNIDADSLDPSYAVSSPGVTEVPEVKMMFTKRSEILFT